MITRTAPDPQLASRDFQRILLIKPSSLGDIIHALPVLHALRERYPHTHLAWLVGDAFADLLEGHLDLDEVIRFDRRRFGRLGTSPSASLAFVQFVRDLRHRRFDLVIDLQGLFRSGFLARATGADVRIGFADAREFAPWFYTHKLAKSDGATHAVDRNLQAISLLGAGNTTGNTTGDGTDGRANDRADDFPVRFNLGIRDEDRRGADELLQAEGIQTGQPFVVVLPGARWETKQWLPERFAEVIDSLADSPGVRCLLLGASDESDLCGRIASASQAAPSNLAGCTSMRGLVAVIERAAAVLCHDSGAMHIAAALRRPLLCIVGPTNPVRTGPYQQPGAVIRLDLSCAPCYLRRQSQCQHEHRCMRELTTDAVVRRFRGLLETSSAIADIQGGGLLRRKP